MPFRASGLINLRSASVGSFEDDRSGWPPRLELDGFVYKGFTSEKRDESYARDAESRLRWLSRNTSGTMQPYRQLAKVLQEAGDTKGAKRVLVEMESIISANHDWLPERGLKALIGYGYRPEKAVYLVGGLTALGWILYRRSLLSIVPTDSEVAERFKMTQALPPNYPRFSPLFYSLENTFRWSRSDSVKNGTRIRHQNPSQNHNPCCGASSLG